MSRKVFDHCNMRAVSVQWVEGRGVPNLYNKQDQLLSKELSLVLSWKKHCRKPRALSSPFTDRMQWNASHTLSVKCGA